MRPQPHHQCPNADNHGIRQAPLPPPLPQQQRQGIEGNDEPAPFGADQTGEKYQIDCNDAHYRLNGQQHIIHDARFHEKANQGQYQQDDGNHHR